MSLNLSNFFFLFFMSMINFILSRDPGVQTILGIEPLGGPVYGETRVKVRLKDFDKTLIDEYNRPKCRFGNYSNTVNATYIECTPRPRVVGDPEPKKEEMVSIILTLERNMYYL